MFPILYLLILMLFDIPVFVWHRDCPLRHDPVVMVTQY